MSEKMPETERGYVARNPHQGTYKRVLCVCTGGILRSPTAAVILAAEPFNFNTRSAGTDSFALIQVDKVLVDWADEVVCMEAKHQAAVDKLGAKKSICLNIPDT